MPYPHVSRCADTATDLPGQPDGGGTSPTGAATKPQAAVSQDNNSPPPAITTSLTRTCADVGRVSATLSARGIRTIMSGRHRPNHALDNAMNMRAILLGVAG
jgi:hypothetical protein